MESKKHERIIRHVVDFDKSPRVMRNVVDVPESLPVKKQEIDDRKAEAKRVVKRLAAIVDDHRQAAVHLEIELGAEDVSAVLGALREHAKGGSGSPVPGARDEIHGYCLNRLFDELVEEPSNILFTTKTGPDSIRYDAMEAEFWMECLDLMEATFCPAEES